MVTKRHKQEGIARPAWGWRSSLVTVVFLASAAVMLVRAVDLQVLRNDFLQDQGQARHLRVVEMPAHRGMVTDRNGEPLAVSTPVSAVWVNPQALEVTPDQFVELANILDEDPVELRDMIGARLDREFVYLQRQVPPDLAGRVEALGIPGVHLQREYKRFYPAGEVTAHLLGFTDIDDRGQEGLELAFDEWLRGEAGAKRVLRDRIGRTIQQVAQLKPARPGQQLATSIDLRLQYIAYRELKAAIQANDAVSGSIVVLDVETGEVLALANQPSYNPNNRSAANASAFRNRAVTDQFEPGSSFKPFPVAAALESGQFTPRTRVDTAPGFLKVSGYSISDTRNYGEIDVTTVLKKSVNVGASKIALALEPGQLWSSLARFGFGSVTGSGFPGEAAGLLPHWQRWREVTQATLAYGYGLSVTPLQLAQAYAVIAADGARLPVSFVKIDEPGFREQVVSPETARDMRRMLETVVSPDGTGTRAAVSGYRVAGKTGTARKAVSGGYAEDRHYAVFAGMAPASDPRLVTVVVINEPRAGDYYGGEIAAPVFANVMAGGLRLLNVVPDHDELREPGRLVAGRLEP
ncbi:MAG: penicillin-binding transpeptidase domain-containing protein [Gammaproteobacteria bacterium]|nr:penicillin-binding transpeptidase domain-containing protein [Gammaproteobacteria bacterium]